MDKDLTVFENKAFGKLTVVEKNGDPWFIAKEVSDILEYSEASAMTRKLDKDEKTTLSFRSSGSNYQTNKTLINESGFYSSVIGSKKPEAKLFKKWVTSEVLPSIRKTGTYSVQTTNKQEPCTFELEMIGAKYLAEMLDFSETSKLEITHAIYKNNRVPTKALPVYTSNVRVNFSAKDLLAKNNCELSPIAFNKLMIVNGFMTNKERSSVGKKKRYFKSLTGKGLEYGKNDASVHSPRETQPHYYEDTFMELYSLLI